MKKLLKLAIKGRKDLLEAQNSIHQKEEWEEYFLMTLIITSEIGKKFSFLIVMVLDIKEPEKIQLHIKTTLCILEVIILQFRDYKVFNKKLVFFLRLKESSLVGNLQVVQQVFTGSIMWLKKLKKPRFMLYQVQEFFMIR
mgnify:CR=1 FL=1